MKKSSIIIASLITLYCVQTQCAIFTKKQLAAIKKEAHFEGALWHDHGNDTSECMEINVLKKPKLSQDDIRTLTERLIPAFTGINEKNERVFNLKHVFIARPLFDKCRAAYVQTHSKIPSFIKKAAYDESADAYYIPRCAFEEYRKKSAQQHQLSRKRKRS